MSSLADLVAEIETDVDAIAGGTRARMSQDYGDATTEFTALGQTRYQIQASYLNQTNEDSAVTRDIVEVELLVHHLLTVFTDEQAYTEGQMATDQLAMIAESFWESMDSVFRVVDDFPAINIVPERSGKRITYSVGIQLALT